jgi:hypothetical protein
MLRPEIGKRSSEMNTRKERNEKSDEIYYTSVEQWELENFPNLTRKRERKQLENNPEALGAAIADEIFQKIGVELSKKK